MLAFDSTRVPSPPTDASTVILLRERSSLEVLLVVRHKRSNFLGGAAVFPGGKLDPEDHDLRWLGVCMNMHPDVHRMDCSRAHAVAAIRECFEEASILPCLSPGSVALAAPADALATLLDQLVIQELQLHTELLVPFARWITPAAEPRRFDARFFVVQVSADTEGACDGHETTSLLWCTPKNALQRFADGELLLAPPTTRCLEILQHAQTAQEAMAIAAAQSLRPVCPEYVEPGRVLALPGDPLHSIQTAHAPGGTRFVQKAGRWISADPPSVSDPTDAT